MKDLFLLQFLFGLFLLLLVRLQFFLLVLCWQLLFPEGFLDFLDVSFAHFLHRDALVGSKVEDGHVRKLSNCAAQLEILRANHVALGIGVSNELLNAGLGSGAEHVPALDELMLLG